MYTKYSINRPSHSFRATMQCVEIADDGSQTSPYKTVATVYNKHTAALFGAAGEMLELLQALPEEQKTDNIRKVIERASTPICVDR